MHQIGLFQESNKYFEIERNTGNGFEIIGKLNGNGNSNEISQYSFIDNAPKKNATNYYRIKQTDYDGTHTFSHCVSAQIENESVRAYPIPAYEFLFVELSHDTNEPLTIQLFDAVGMVQYTNTFSLQEGSNQLILDVDRINTGNYFLQGKTASGTFIQKKITIE